MCHTKQYSHNNSITSIRYPVRAGAAVFMCLAMLAAAALACGGNVDGAIGPQTAQPENLQIAGLPQFVCASSTPIPTNTQPATAIQPTIYATANPLSYATNTPYPGLLYYCLPPSYSVCYYVTRTPYPGGIYTTPGAIYPGATSTPRPTYTVYPSPTAYVSSFLYVMGDTVYTDPSSDTLTLSLQIGNVRTQASNLYTGMQIVTYEVTIQNLGSIFYVFAGPFQIYVAQVNGQMGSWYASEEAAAELGIGPDALAEPALDIVVVEPGETIDFDLYAYTPLGQVENIAYILDPYANGYDETIAGGNVAYWNAGEREDCAGAPGADFTPFVNLTPKLTATATATIDWCGAIDFSNCFK